MAASIGSRARRGPCLQKTLSSDLREASFGRRVTSTRELRRRDPLLVGPNCRSKRFDGMVATLVIAFVLQAGQASAP